MDKNSSLASQTLCDHMFSDPKSDHTFHVFWLRTWFIYFFFLYVKISTYFEDGKVLEYTVSRFPIDSNQLLIEDYILLNTEPNSK